LYSLASIETRLVVVIIGNIYKGVKELFTLTNGREHLWQWDSNQRILVDDPTINEVHFCNKTTPNSLVVETYTDDTYDGKVYAEIPNILLQESWDICVYAFCNCYTKVEERIKVKARSKPEDYVYTETEVLNYQTLLDKMNDIDENIGKSVEDYLTEHPIEAGATQEEVAQINKNTEDIATLNTEIDNLPTKQYVDDAVKNVEVDLTGYATEQWVNNQGYLKTVPSEYVTENELTAKGYATNSQLSAYAMKSDIPTVPTKVSQLENDKKYLTDSALGDYAKKTDIPQKVSYFENDADYVKQSELPSVPTKVSELENDKDYTTEQYVDGAIEPHKVFYIDVEDKTVDVAYPLDNNMQELVTYFDKYGVANVFVRFPNQTHTIGSEGYTPARIYKFVDSYNICPEGIDTHALASGMTQHTIALTIYTSTYKLSYLLGKSEAVIATKEYVDSLFKGIATAEGGSY